MLAILREGTRALGLELSTGHLELFEAYYHELSAWNQRFNLTAIMGYEQVQYRHFVDSLSCLLAFPRQGWVGDLPNTVPLQLGRGSLWCLDVGSGAGFPGIPLKILLPEAKMVLLEATGKKARFLRHIANVLHLSDVQVLDARAEDIGHMPEYRERFDVVVSRAVAHLSVLCEYCLPFCRVGGRMIAPKGEDAAAEAQAAWRAMEVLGGSLVQVKPVSIEGLPSERNLVVVDKTAKTPDTYPRRVGVPSKRPIASL